MGNRQRLIRREDSPCGQNPPPGVSEVPVRQTLYERSPRRGGPPRPPRERATPTPLDSASSLCSQQEAGQSLQDKVACPWLGEYSR